MNFLSLGLKTLKKANKAKQEQIHLNETYTLHGINSIIDPELIKQNVIQREMELLTEAFDIGMSYYKMAKEKLNNPDRTYLLTIRPPNDTSWNTFFNDTLFYIKKWSGKWSWYEYTYEQKGETNEDAGKGFHIHILFATETSNYYPSHIIRNTSKHFPYVANNCIDCQTVKNITRAKEYIRGIKNNETKESSVKIDSVWRQSLGLKELYTDTEIEVKSNALSLNFT